MKICSVLDCKREIGEQGSVMEQLCGYHYQLQWRIRKGHQRGTLPFPRKAKDQDIKKSEVIPAAAQRKHRKSRRKEKRVLGGTDGHKAGAYVKLTGTSYVFSDPALWSASHGSPMIAILECGHGIKTVSSKMNHRERMWCYLCTKEQRKREKEEARARAAAVAKAATATPAPAPAPRTSRSANAPRPALDRITALLENVNDRLAELSERQTKLEEVVTRPVEKAQREEEDDRQLELVTT